MSVTKIMELRAEIDKLEHRLAELKAELHHEVLDLKGVFPPDLDQRTQDHAEKYSTTPKKGPATISEYFQGK